MVIIRERSQALTRELLTTLLQSLDGVIFDADGVLWHNAGAIAGSASFVQSLVDRGIRVALATNNSTLSRANYVHKCERLGFGMFNQDNIVTTSAVCADYMRRKNFEGKRVYVCADTGVVEELKLAGIDSFGAGPDDFGSDPDYGKAGAFYNKLEDDVGAVVVGFDKCFNFTKLCKAAVYLSNPDVWFVATNTDEQFPQHDGKNIPGTGSLVKAIETGSQRSATVVGKPHAPMFDYLQHRWQCKPERVLMIGDRCNTDIRWANTFGMQSLCVLSGVTSEAQLSTYANTDCMPQYYAPSLAAIDEMMPSIS